MSALPPEIGNLENLQWLNLDSNQLSSLPIEIGNLRNIKWLYLADNPLLDTLPDDIDTYNAFAVLEYLENQAWWHLQRMIVAGLSSVGIIAGLILGLRWRQHRKWAKKKRKGA